MRYSVKTPPLDFRIKEELEFCPLIKPNAIKCLMRRRQKRFEECEMISHHGYAHSSSGIHMFLNPPSGIIISHISQKTNSFHHLIAKCSPNHSLSDRENQEMSHVVLRILGFLSSRLSQGRTKCLTNLWSALT